MLHKKLKDKVKTYQRMFKYTTPHGQNGAQNERKIIKRVTNGMFGSPRQHTKIG